jgi:hypothetical protein
MQHTTVHSIAHCYLYSTEITYGYLLIWNSPFSSVYYLLLSLTLSFTISTISTTGLILIQFHVSFYCFIQLFCIYCVYFWYFVTTSIYLGNVGGGKKRRRNQMRCWPAMQYSFHNISTCYCTDACAWSTNLALHNFSYNMGTGPEELGDIKHVDVKDYSSTSNLIITP